MRILLALLFLASGIGLGADSDNPPASTRPFTNRLAGEKSPYLLQHAHNPVDWYPWGDEAFATARKQNKPIFLSIGYSTCHWCHVMERESFSDPAMAKLINDNFIPIKVDREQRPDLDAVYMTFVEATTGSGGWPMTVFLTPDRKPFFGGTYFPPEAHDGLPGLKTLLENVHQAWLKDHDKIVASAEDITRQLRRFNLPQTNPAPQLGNDILVAGTDRFAAEYDSKFPGFSMAPKFPRPVVLQFLLRESVRTGKPQPRDMALATLRAMANGGIHDQLGGGFHRYSTDRRWFLPHFEKMLYDQAELASVYLDAYQITHDQFFANIARDIFDYVLRDMSGRDGGFYSAEDADNAPDPDHPEVKREGAFYVWTASQITGAVGIEAAKIFNYRFGVDDAGNIGVDPRHEFGAANVLSIAHPIDETASHFGRSAHEVEDSLASSRSKLLAVRQARIRPARDEKILTAWNGLMISALARGATALGEDRYRRVASDAAQFIRSHLYDSNSGTLRRSYFDGRASVPGMLSDSTLYIQGLLDLYQTTLDIHWLSFAIELQHKQDALFADAKAGGYFDSADGDASLLLRTRGIEDNAEPSGNSVAAMNLLRLGRMSDDANFTAAGKALVQTFAGVAHQSPSAVPALLLAYEMSVSRPRQIVIAGNPTGADTRAMLEEIGRYYLPDAVVLGADGGEGQVFFAKRIDALKDMTAIGNKATAYVCENFTCQLPTNDLARFTRELEQSVATTRPGL